MMRKVELRSIKTVEGLIELQKALTYARTSSFDKTIQHSQESRRIFSISQDHDFDKIRDIFIWWTYIVESICKMFQK